MDVAATVHEILMAISGVADFADDTPLGGEPHEQRGLCLDSLDRLEVVIRLEEAFNIDIPDADADRPDLGTPSGIVAYVERRLGP